MEKSLMLHQLIEHYAEGNKAKFARMLGIQVQRLHAWIARDTYDMATLYRLPGISAEWLATGKGNMLTITDTDQLKGCKTKHEEELLGEIISLNKRLEAKEKQNEELRHALHYLESRCDQFVKTAKNRRTKKPNYN